MSFPFFIIWSGKRVSNSRPQPWQGCALPTELFPRKEASILRIFRPVSSHKSPYCEGFISLSFAAMRPLSSKPLTAMLKMPRSGLKADQLILC